MAFKGVPPKRKRNPSKFCEGEVGGVLQDQENRSDPLSPLNGYLKTASSLCIDNFQVLRKLGEGSFSQVFLVVERSTGALLALKVMEKAGLQELGVVDRLASELKIQQFCTHLNIVKLYGVFHDAARIYLIQEFAGSRSLFTRME
jgi:serine/threonine protein kinase